jgi:GT2 family glycosyltransferase
LKPDYLQKSFDIYDAILSEMQWNEESKKKDSSLGSKWQKQSKWQFVLVPKLMFRQTWKIQNEWFDYYNFWTSRPHQFHFSDGQKFAQIQMYSWNSLFWPTKIFQEVLFDERFDFVYEDLEFTYRIHKAWHPIFISSELEIYHMERDKTLLEDAWIGSEFQCHRKARHRMRFVRKNATTIQKIQFYLLWFRAQPLRLISKILRLAPKKERKTLIWALIRGTIEGMKN